MHRQTLPNVFFKAKNVFLKTPASRVSPTSPGVQQYGLDLGHHQLEEESLLAKLWMSQAWQGRIPKRGRQRKNNTTHHHSIGTTFFFLSVNLSDLCLLSLLHSFGACETGFAQLPISSITYLL